jgi:hypothetical protein
MEGGVARAGTVNIGETLAIWVSRNWMVVVICPAKHAGCVGMHADGGRALVPQKDCTTYDTGIDIIAVRVVFVRRVCLPLCQ